MATVKLSIMLAVTALTRGQIIPQMTSDPQYAIDVTSNPLTTGQSMTLPASQVSNTNSEKSHRSTEIPEMTVSKVGPHSTDALQSATSVILNVSSGNNGMADCMLLSSAIAGLIALTLVVI